MRVGSDHADHQGDNALTPGWPAEAGLIAMSVAAAIGMGRLFADASFLPVVVLAVLASHGLSMLCRRNGVGPLALSLIHI